MWKACKTIFKSGVVMFGVGALLALVAGPVAEALGAAHLVDANIIKAAHETPVVWTGAFFGAFGVIQSVVSPLYDAIVGETSESKSAPEHMRVQQPERTVELAPEMDGRTTSFVMRLEAERAANAQSRALH